MLQQEIDERETELRAHEKKLSKAEEEYEGRVASLKKEHRNKVDELQVEIFEREVEIDEINLRMRQYLVELTEAKDTLEEITNRSNAGGSTSVDHEALVILRKEK